MLRCKQWQVGVDHGTGATVRQVGTCAASPVLRPSGRGGKLATGTAHGLTGGLYHLAAVPSRSRRRPVRRVGRDGRSGMVTVAPPPFSSPWQTGDLARRSCGVRHMQQRSAPRGYPLAHAVRIAFLNPPVPCQNNLVAVEEMWCHLIHPVDKSRQLHIKSWGKIKRGSWRCCVLSKQVGASVTRSAASF
jgi:hypothetical protein